MYDLDLINRTLADHTPDTSPSESAERRAAVAMILRQGTDGLESLFIKRAEHPGDPWSGQMAFPGGRQDPEDDTVEHAARRETLEEVGLRLDPEMVIGRLSDVYGGRLKQHRLSVSPFVYHHPEPGELTHNYEVAETVWVPLSFMADPGNVSPYVFHLDPMSRPFPSYQYNGYTIWGLTYRILTSYFELFGVDLPGETAITEVE